jgi:hypothetical protein
MKRLHALVSRSIAAVIRRSRDILALGGIGCIAVGLSTVSPALSWIAVGAFLFAAAGAGRRSAA